MCLAHQRSIPGSAKEVSRQVVIECQRNDCVVKMSCEIFWILLLFPSTMQRLLDQRQNLKFMVAEGLTPVQCWRRLEAVYGEETMSKPTVCRWHARFHEGDGLTPVTDLVCSGRPCVQISLDKIEAAQAAVEEDRRASLKQIAQKVGVSVTTAHRLVKKKLSLKHKVAKFVPRVLSDEQKRTRVKFCRENLDRLRNDAHLLDKLVCGDESPVYLHDPETRNDSKQWLPKDSLRPRKALRQRAQRKTMLTAFFDAHGIILIEFNEGRVNSETYIETLKQLKENIWHKRPFLWKGGVDGETDHEFVLQHDNASCHTSVPTLAYIFDTNLLAHPPYSPDLVPCDYFLFPFLKQKLRSHKHCNLRDLKTAVTRTLHSLTEDQCQEALCKLPLRWRKCVEAQGEYFEGCGVDVPFDPYFDLGPNHDQQELNEEATDSDSDS